jgi:hypothetical protein
MTEDEAMTKWCPFAMAPGASFALNRGPEGVANGRCMCLASACMAWQWDKPIRKMRNMETGVERVVLGGEPYIPNVEQPFEEQNSNGFCGLAGRP